MGVRGSETVIFFNFLKEYVVKHYIWAMTNYLLKI